MQARLLVFDPDIEGRRLLRDGLSIPDLELKLILRATGETACATIETMRLDAILIGLPTDPADLILLVSQIQNLDHCPPLIFLHSESVPNNLWFLKNEEGLRQLRSRLVPEIRAFKLKRASSQLQSMIHQADGSARSQLAEQVTEILAELDIPAMYISVDEVDFVLELRSSNYTAEVEQQLISITDDIGGVRLTPAALAAPLNQLIAGEADARSFSSDELLTALLPGVNLETRHVLDDLLGVADIHVLAIRTDRLLNGFLLLGYAPDELEQEALLEFAGKFGQLLKYAEDYDLLGQQARSMRVLQDVMLSLSATLDPSDLLDTVLDKLERVVPYELAGIALYKDEHLQLLASRGALADLQLLEPSRGDQDDILAIILWMIDQGQPLRLESDDPDVPEELHLRSSGFETWIGVPISWGDERLGYLFLANKHSGEMEAIHLEIAVGFARQLAIALQNARLLQGSQARAERMRLVNDIGRYAISVLDPQQLVEEVAERVSAVFDYFAVRILLVEGEQLVPYAFSGVGEDQSLDEERMISLEEVPEIARALREDKPVYVDADAAIWQQVRPAQVSEAQAAVFIPLSVVTEVVGIMEIYAKSKGALGQEDLDVLQALAAQIAISVVNARLFSEIRSHAVELESRVELRTQELQSQKERTEAILRSVADAILVLDLDGEVVLTNPRGQELLQGAQGEALYESVRSLFVAEGVVQSSVEIGQVTYQALASPVELDGAAQGTVVVLRDITRLRELDQLKSQFVATVSHELRTPLTNIKLYLSLLRNAEVDKSARYHKVLVRETERLSEMIEDLLNLSRLEAQQVVDKEPVVLAELLELVSDNHEPACISKDIKLATDFEDEVMILADRAQIIQVFTNLMANAIAYTPVGGEISIHIADRDEIDGVDYIKVVLSDSGIGIRKEDLPHVFDRFYRGTGAQEYKAEGSGLGLAIVREILDNHEAKIAVDSQPGKGTKFSVWLPAWGE